MRSRDVNAATRLAEACWRLDNVLKYRNIKETSTKMYTPFYIGLN